MKQLLLMRHAKSSWKDSSLTDHQRPLNKRGKRDAPKMGLLLNEQGLIPEIILCSTAERAKLTVQYLLESCEFEGDVQYFDALYHADYSTYIEHLSQLPTEIDLAMIVGHNPEMNNFLYTLCDVYEHMPTAAIAHIAFVCQHWSDLDHDFECEVNNLWKPRELV